MVHRRHMRTSVERESVRTSSVLGGAATSFAVGIRSRDSVRASLRPVGRLPCTDALSSREVWPCLTCLVWVTSALKTSRPMPATATNAGVNTGRERRCKGDEMRLRVGGAKT